MIEDSSDDSLNDDNHGERRLYQRRRSVFDNGALVKIAGALTAVILIVGFLMQVLGWRFTGSGADIKQNAVDITANKVAISTNTATLATLTASAATSLSAQTQQGRDIADLKASLMALLFVNCGIYTKVYAGAPEPSQCGRQGGQP